MGLILQKNWNKGWISDADEMNGPPDAFLRMDNLVLDEIGAVELVNGTSVVSTPGGNVLGIYSKAINGAKVRYSFNFSGGTGIIKRGATGSEVSIVTEAGSPHACFGNGFGQIFIGSGNQSKKDDGTTTRNWGVQGPVAVPGAVSQQPPLLDLSGGTFATPWTIVEGVLLTDSSTYAGATLDATTFRGNVQFIPGSGNLDATAFGGGNVFGDDDIFSITVRPGDSDKLIKTRVEFLLSVPSGSNNDVTDYYYFEWPARDTTFYRPGLNQWGKLECQRGDFTRIGKDPTLTWATVKAVRVTFFGTSQINCLFNQLWFLGGSKGPLLAGTFNSTPGYQYIQVNVLNTGVYVTKSNMSPPTSPIDISNSTIVLTPDTAVSSANVSEAWFFRIGGTLPDYYFVGKCAYPGGTFTDNVSDEQALRVGILLNRFNTPVTSTVDFNGNTIGITDEILAIDGPFHGRMLIITFKNIYITNYLDPESFDSRTVINLSANVGEKNLFCHIIQNSFIVIGTTADLYEISGSLGNQPDGSLDVSINPLGIEQPPISEGHCVLDNVLYYVANDGLRYINGGISQLVPASPRLLFKGQTRYGLSGINVGFAGSIQYELCANKNKVYTIVYHLDSSASLFVYDTIYKYWYRYATNPGCLFSEEDGFLLGGYSDGKVRRLDTGTNFDGSQNIMVNLRTVLLDGGQPLQRKDLFVLKLVVDTGNSQIDINIADEINGLSLLTTTQTNGLLPIYLRLDNTIHNLQKKLEIQITDHAAAGVAKFRLTELSIDYMERPVPVAYVRVPPTNYGVAGRKRIEEIPFIVDTLNQSINVAGILDEVIQPTQSVTTNEKSVANYRFNVQTYGTNVGLLLIAPNSGQTFEFYDIVQPRSIDVIPDSVLYHRIPSSNLGTASRKRIFHYAFVIDTRGSNVTFTPFIDGISYPSQVYNTVEKTTVLYAFLTEAIGIDIWGTLSGTIPFEFYNLNLEECVIEKMPPRGTHYVVPNNNFGVAAQKRMRVIPMVINTFGKDVVFTPTVDNVSILTEVTTFNTLAKKTVFQLFRTDQFGVDYGGILDGAGNNFEFYGFGEPDNVEILPPPKLFDQAGPLQLDRSGKLLEFRTRMIARALTVGFNIFMDDSSVYTGIIQTLPNTDKVYSQRMPRSIIGTVCRIEFSSNLPFNRWNCKMRIDLAGAATDNQWMTVR